MDRSFDVSKNNRSNHFLSRHTHESAWASDWNFIRFRPKNISKLIFINFFELYTPHLVKFRLILETGRQKIFRLFKNWSIWYCGADKYSSHIAYSLQGFEKIYERLFNVGKINSIVVMYFLVVPQFVEFFQELGKQWIYYIIFLNPWEQGTCTPYYTIYLIVG